MHGPYARATFSHRPRQSSGVQVQPVGPPPRSQFISAALDRDYTLLMGTTVILLLFVIVLNFIVDLLYAWLDPRIRSKGAV